MPSSEPVSDAPCSRIGHATPSDGGSGRGRRMPTTCRRDASSRLGTRRHSSVQRTRNAVRSGEVWRPRTWRRNSSDELGLQTTLIEEAIANQIEDHIRNGD